MKSTKHKRAVTILCAPVLVVGVAYGIVLRLSNPDMTETRLFVEYWPLWTICAIAAVGLAGAADW